MINSKFTLLILAACMVTTAGCASKSGTERDFGDSVRQVTNAQVYDPNAAANPDPSPVVGGDPDRLNNSLDGHRKDVASPAGVAAPVTVNVGNGNR